MGNVVLPQCDTQPAALKAEDLREARRNRRYLCVGREEK